MKDYDVALSFAGEERTYVQSVAEALIGAGIKVFYDDFEKVSLWGKNLYDYLQDIYKNKATFCVMFISASYAKKRWTSHERQSAQARAFVENEEYILPARFDDTEIPGLNPTIGYVDLRRTSPAEIARLIVLKLQEKGLLQGDEGTLDVIELNRRINALAIDPTFDVRNPMRFRLCPKCGYGDLDREIVWDRHQGMDVGTVECKRCNWKDSDFLYGKEDRDFYQKKFPGIRELHH